MAGWWVALVQAVAGLPVVVLVFMVSVGAVLMWQRQQHRHDEIMRLIDAQDQGGLDRNDALRAITARVNAQRPARVDQLLDGAAAPRKTAAPPQAPHPRPPADPLIANNSGDGRGLGG